MTRRFPALAAWWLLALAVALAFAAAGRWQLARMHEKEAMLVAAAHASARAMAQPLLLASDPGRARDYDWAQGSGRLADATVWLDNQQRGGRVGVRMYCVLFPDDGVQAMLVDAGWWPLPGDRALPRFGCPARGAQVVRGLLAPPPSEGLQHGVAVEARPDRHWLAARMDMGAIASALRLSSGLAPRVLRLDPARAPGDSGAMLAPGERDLETLSNTMSPQRHLGYAVQWFGLAAAVVLVALVMTLRRRRQ